MVNGELGFVSQLHLTRCDLSQVFNISMPQFFHLQNADNDNSSVPRWVHHVECHAGTVHGESDPRELGDQMAKAGGGVGTGRAWSSREDWARPRALWEEGGTPNAGRRSQSENGVALRTVISQSAK